MIYPNKIIPYSNSTISLFPSILEQLIASEKTPSELMKACKIDSTADFIAALDALCALGKVELSEDERRVRYVG